MNLKYIYRILMVLLIVGTQGCMILPSCPHPALSVVIRPVTNEWLISDVSAKDAPPSSYWRGNNNSIEEEEIKEWKRKYTYQADIIVEVRNTSSRNLDLFEEWNSWGYDNLKFVFSDGFHESWVTKKPGIWYRNFSSFHSLRPGESITIPVALTILGKTLGHPWKGALGAAVFAQKPTTSEVDNREVYLHVEAPTFSSAVECGASSGKEARDLAAKINTQSKRFADIQRALPAKREAARRRHAEAKTTAESEIRSGQNALHSVKRDNSHTGGIERARQELAEARNDLRRKRE